MDSKDIRNLQEAYLDVYQEVDESATRIAPKIRGAKDDVKYMDGRSPGGMSISGNSQVSGAGYMQRGGGVQTQTNPNMPPVNPGRMDSGTRIDLKYRQAQLKAKGGSSSSAGAGSVSSISGGSSYDVGGQTPSRGFGLSGIKLANSYEPDLYDTILEYLINEGYADTIENAESIMVNMSEDWRESIVEEVLDEGYVDYRKGKLPSGRTPQQAAQGRSEVLNTRERNRPLGKLDGNYSRQESQNRRTKEMDKLTASNPVSRAVRRGLGDMLPGGQPSTDRHINAMDRRNRVADIASAEKKSRSRYQHEVDPNY